MNKESARVDFNFSWQALKLLGKSLYSNAWSAISELVANGFDANAERIYVLIDTHDKNHSTIQIADLGNGMALKDIDIYVTVGYDRRLASAHSGIYNSSIMGRKGIGKLAALYLSDEYYIQTKTSGNKESTWRLSSSQADNSSTPYLEKVSNDSVKSRIDEWTKCPHGTLLELRDVNLSGLGKVAFENLSMHLANRFLLDSMAHKSIYLCIIDSEKDAKVIFNPVSKMIAYKNFAGIAISSHETSSLPAEIIEIISNPPTISIPHSRETIGKEVYRRTVEVFDLDNADDDCKPTQGEYEVAKEDITDEQLLRFRSDITSDSDIIRIPYSLNGWIAYHATIDQASAKENDERFSRNKFYNPSQIRLYVRNKLAIENVLPYLGITHAFSNYIEGEISFDLLDDDLLPDIATSSRQGFDALDGRWLLLLEILRPRVDKLIRSREKLANAIKKEAFQKTASEESRAKEQATRNFRAEIENIPKLPPGVKDEVAEMQARQLKGEIGLKAKSNYLVFLSHQRKDKCFSDFIYYLLKRRGANDNELFYTTVEPDPSKKYSCLDPLAQQIRNNLISHNTLIVYITGEHFKTSEYCLFEAGAGWATRSVSEYQILADQYDDIPDYLTNGKPERFLRNSNGTIELDELNYGRVVDLLNTLISHINKGRSIKDEEAVQGFEVVSFPDRVQMKRDGKVLTDYMDSDLVDYWKEYIANGVHFRKKSSSQKDAGIETENE